MTKPAPLAPPAGPSADLIATHGPLAPYVVELLLTKRAPLDAEAILEALGAWLHVNGEAIFGTRPWTRFAGTTDGDVPVRFTRSGDGRTVYAMVLGTPGGTSLVLRTFPESVRSVRLLGGEGTLSFARDGADLRVTLPKTLPAAAAYAFAITLD